MSGTGLTESAVWQQLKQHHGEIKGQHMRDWFAEDVNRFERFKLQAAGLTLDYS